MYCFFFAHICQLANVGETPLQNILNPLKPLRNKGFPQLKKISKNRQTNWQGLADKLCHL